MLYLELHRDKQTDKQILGTLKVKLCIALLRFKRAFTVFFCKTLELPWRENMRKISCVPVRRYDVFKRLSDKNGRCLELENVPNRSHIQIHVLNTYKQTEGCIGVGQRYSDIDGDGYVDVIKSGATMKILFRLLPKRTFIHIIDGKGIDTTNIGKVSG